MEFEANNSTENAITVESIKISHDYFVYNNECDLLSSNNLNTLYWATLSLKNLYNFNFYNYLNLTSTTPAYVESSFFDVEEDLIDELNHLLYIAPYVESLLIKSFILDFLMLSTLLSKNI